MGMIWESMAAAEFVGMASSPKFLGNARIKTQHFIGGAAKWAFSGSSGDEITGMHQMRVAHQKYKDDELTEVLRKGHAHGKATVQYRRVEGVWKFAGLTPDIRWSEHEYDLIFRDDN